MIVAGMCLYTPWSRTAVLIKDSKNVPLQMQYAFLLRPPDQLQKEDRDLIVRFYYQDSPFVLYEQKDKWNIMVSIDIRRLFVQCAFVLFVGVGLVFLCRDKDNKVNNVNG